MALTPPSNADIAIRPDIEHWQALLKVDVVHAQALTDARIGRFESRMQAHVGKVVVGTGVALYLAMVGTAFTGFGLLLSILEIV